MEDYFVWYYVYVMIALIGWYNFVKVRLLEKSFEEENKLEPERKSQLASKLGLQPRQVAVWFQNRRARWKTKQLERDYDHLKSAYDSLLSEFDCIRKENDKLKAEVTICLLLLLVPLLPPTLPLFLFLNKEISASYWKNRMWQYECVLLWCDGMRGRSHYLFYGQN